MVDERAILIEAEHAGPVFEHRSSIRVNQLESADSGCDERSGLKQFESGDQP